MLAVAVFVAFFFVFVLVSAAEDPPTTFMFSHANYKRPSSLQKVLSSLPGRKWSGPVLILLVAATTLVAASLPSASSVSLPILVYPPDGTSEHVESVTLTVEDASAVDSLYVQAHQPFYTITGWDEGVADGSFDPEGAAEIRLNGDAGGNWISVRDGNVDCAFPEEVYGCVAGIYHTIRFTIPASSVQSGSNTIEFKFNGTKGVRSGYRVLGVGFMTPSSPSVQEFDPHRHGAHDPSQLVTEDVSEWSPPDGFGNSTDIQEGDRLWSETGILRDIDGTDIRASCGSCHAKDGRDLKYFGYSNRTIVARSRAHGLSKEQGKQIAAYIRSRSLRTESGATYDAPGRPWNPPYQPGPSGFGPNDTQGPDEANPQYWAAGAGLEWVLDSPREDPGTNRDMLAYFFPASGDHSDPRGVAWYNDAVTGHQELPWQEVSTDSTHNMRLTPLAIQFPDWNSWLPKIHPIDTAPDLFVGGEARYWYRQELPDAIASRDLGSLEKATRRINFGLKQDGILPDPPQGSFTNNKYAIASQGVRQWLAVKYWETFHGHHFQDEADDAYCNDPDRPWCEPLGWIGRQRIPFDLAGHISAPSGQQDSPWIYANEAQEKALSHIWYHLQLIINPGTQPKTSGQNPVDVGYQRGHVRYTEAYGPPSDFRNFQTEVKMWQQHSIRGVVDSDRRGWNANISRTNFFDSIELSDPKVERALHTAGMRAWWDQMRRHAVSDFPREKTNPFYWPESYPPESGEWTSNTNQGQQTYQYLIKSNKNGNLPASLIDSIGTEWGQPMWPTTGEETSGPRWDEIANPPLRQSIQLSKGWNFVSSRVAPSDSSVEQVFANVDGLSTVKDAYGQAYLPQLGVNQIGTWSTSEGYKVHVEETQETTFTGDPVGRDTPIDLKEGWNLLPYYPGDPMDAATALASIADAVKVVRDEDGNEYVPSQGTNDIGDLVPGDAYAVYVVTDTTLVYPNP
jgi:hypothetical protein